MHTRNASRNDDPHSPSLFPPLLLLLSPPQLLPINSGGGLIVPDSDDAKQQPYGIIYTLANIPNDDKVFT